MNERAIYEFVKDLTELKSQVASAKHKATKLYTQYPYTGIRSDYEYSILYGTLRDVISTLSESLALAEECLINEEIQDFIEEEF